MLIARVNIKAAPHIAPQRIQWDKLQGSFGPRNSLRSVRTMKALSMDLSIGWLMLFSHVEACSMKMQGSEFCAKAGGEQRGCIPKPGRLNKPLRASRGFKLSPQVCIWQRSQVTTTSWSRSQGSEEGHGHAIWQSTSSSAIWRRILWGKSRWSVTSQQVLRALHQWLFNYMAYLIP